jgi:hypothetical protein
MPKPALSSRSSPCQAREHAPYPGRTCATGAPTGLREKARHPHPGDSSGPRLNGGFHRFRHRPSHAGTRPLAVMDLTKRGRFESSYRAE